MLVCWLSVHSCNRIWNILTSNLLGKMRIHCEIACLRLFNVCFKTIFQAILQLWWHQEFQFVILKKIPKTNTKTWTLLDKYLKKPFRLETTLPPKNCRDGGFRAWKVFGFVYGFFFTYFFNVCFNYCLFCHFFFFKKTKACLCYFGSVYILALEFETS